ncbi:hypothetical protein CVT24_000777 [Panaeolus cyanescens]|uniref:GH16 domain-containing protein n=1 Tax=Panaeolus cyanescens TaxID=181874 RepID=A0A409YCM0_9AGAR|nr:hypothetical protein CVT24_000777 [Panaeolus cyanescens]
MKPITHGAVLLGLALSIIPIVSAEKYDMIREYSGSTFFNGWDFYGAADNLTNGDANFVTADQAASSKLAFVDPASNHAFVKVDNVTQVAPLQKRDTVRIQTSVRYGIGSVWIADFLHVPYGCSVWPAWWSQAPIWPQGGEIDTFEGVNMITNNRMSLHTTPGCTQMGQQQTSSQILSPDCSADDNNNMGCVNTDPNPASYGAPFAQAGGGIFVTELAASGVSIWFFSRKDIPSVLSSGNSFDTSQLGLPTANYPNTGCDPAKFFQPQHLILDITLCGDFARPTISDTCPSTPDQCYPQYVLGPPTNYDTAYFEIASIRVFSKTGTNTTVTDSSGAYRPSIFVNGLGSWTMYLLTGMFIWAMM